MRASVIVVAGLAGLLATEPSAAGDFAETVEVESGGTLHLEIAHGAIEVTSHDADVVRIEGRVRPGWPWNVEFELRREGSDVRVTSRPAVAEGVLARVVDFALWPFGHAHGDVRAWVPARYSLDAHTTGGAVAVEGLRGTVAATTSGGPVRVHDVEGSVHVETSGGPIEVDDVRGDLRAATSGGPIGVARVTGGVDVRTSGGPIEVRDAAARVAARTSGGPIAVAFAGAAAGDLETSGGGIDVRLPPGAGAQIDAETSGGRIDITGEMENDGTSDSGRVVGRLNGGGAALRLRTAGGSIRVRPL